MEAGRDSVKDSVVFPLDLPQGMPGPPLFGRESYVHDVTDFAFGHNETISRWNPQAGSQWDGFRHVRHPAHGYYNGLTDTDHGVHHWAAHGIVGRGVLLDLGRWRERQGRPLDLTSSEAIGTEQLSQCLAAQGTIVEPGDILLIRTGWLDWYKATSPVVRRELSVSGVAGLSYPGLEPGREMAAFLWNLHPAAIAADNPAIERWPRGWPRATADVDTMLADPEHGEDIFLHFSLLPLLGIPMGELWDVGALAEACDADKRYEFLLASAPMNLPQGVGSAANAIAVR